MATITPKQEKKEEGMVLTTSSAGKPSPTEQKEVKQKLNDGTIRIDY